MIVVERDGDVVGGALGLLTDGAAGVSMIAFEPAARGRGLARLVMQIIEIEAMARGAREIGLGSVDAALGFYEALGYQGKKTYKHKPLPLPGPVRERKVAALMQRLGDLDAGAEYCVDSATGRVPTIL